MLAPLVVLPFGNLKQERKGEHAGERSHDWGWSYRTSSCPSSGRICKRPNLPNYGVVSENPELMDINFGNVGKISPTGTKAH